MTPPKSTRSANTPTDVEVLNDTTSPDTNIASRQLDDMRNGNGFLASPGWVTKGNQSTYTTSYNEKGHDDVVTMRHDLAFVMGSKNIVATIDHTKQSVTYSIPLADLAKYNAQNAAAAQTPGIDKSFVPSQPEAGKPPIHGEPCDKAPTKSSQAPACNVAPSQIQI